MEELFASPMYGASYEGYVIENIIAHATRWQSVFYRTSNGAEIDLVLTKGQRNIAIEIKASTSPKVSKGFWGAIETIKPEQAYVIAPVDQAYPVADNVIVTPMQEFIEVLM